MSVRSLVAPWPGKTGRVLTCLGPLAAAEYAEAVALVAPRIEGALSDAVHGGRVASFDPFLIEPWRDARIRYRHAALELSLAFPVAIRLDVEDCFRSIARAEVLRALHGLGASSETVSRVGTFLTKTRAAGIPGLPVGPEPSAVLANAVLMRLDVGAEAAGVAHVRWYDDLTIFAPSTRRALAGEEAIVRACWQIGLRLHSGKRRSASGPAAIRRLILAGGAAASAPS